LRPGVAIRSNIVTPTPAAAMTSAAISPAGPAPPIIACESGATRTFRIQKRLAENAERNRPNAPAGGFALNRYLVANSEGKENETKQMRRKNRRGQFDCGVHRS
jgi:hypothetical protein